MASPAKRVVSSADSFLSLTGPSSKSPSSPSSTPTESRGLSPHKPNPSNPEDFSSECPLLKLSSEIRIMIFSLVFPTSGLVWKSEDGRCEPIYVAHVTSELLIALRPEPLLYQEALQVFRNQNAFSLRECTHKAKLSASAAQGIRKVFLKKQCETRPSLAIFNGICYANSCAGMAGAMLKACLSAHGHRALDAGPNSIGRRTWRSYTYQAHLATASPEYGQNGIGSQTPRASRSCGN